MIKKQKCFTFECDHSLFSIQEMRGPRFFFLSGVEVGGGARVATRGLQTGLAG